MVKLDENYPTAYRNNSVPDCSIVFKFNTEFQDTIIRQWISSAGDIKLDMASLLKREMAGVAREALF